MPVSVARKVEFFIADQGLDLDVRLQPIALTLPQVKGYRLPRTPIKPSERRKASPSTAIPVLASDLKSAGISIYLKQVKRDGNPLGPL